jgi:ribonucleoside-triphosphate reductase
MLKKKHILDGYKDLQEIDAADPLNQEIVSRFRVMTAPTLVVIRNGEVRKFDNASRIMSYAAER